MKNMSFAVIPTKDTAEYEKPVRSRNCFPGLLSIGICDMMRFDFESFGSCPSFLE